ncbi:MAG: low molecular weight phosphotyrosine protein phosphatase [Nitrospina sp.]|jgi:protein-tyrosine phosphatase|nr:low molecular weight phosphotyrosine protein phosphatase [Nitrospina sp.]MBT3507914.1 low molecular weight phosphotyrosine protein phosphatase [Nitrospina sp.]MBT3876440.1 low molecular weight phosphotyrosine protein phosphatase [Nitrospina sp.]MBT4048739.1 low molecular weight phosphotyrosine protein phosphatase [Nitrospina sp.]MBT4558026.1 low molecular weight phosphotyrosine protein phosphatase [Nitrospina sp.]
MNSTVEVCFVCLGNICRSPLAQGVFEALVKNEGLQDRIIISSAGVGNWHVGNPPDARMQQTARKHGIHLTSRGRQFQAGDFKRMDLVLAMDQSNLSALQQMQPASELQDKLFLFRTFDPDNNGDLEVPDPYYGGDHGFETVYQMVERTCPKVLERLKTQLAKKHG